MKIFTSYRRADSKDIVDRFQDRLLCLDFVGNVRQWASTSWGENQIRQNSLYENRGKHDQRFDLNPNRQFAASSEQVRWEMTLIFCNAVHVQDKLQRTPVDWIRSTISG